MDGTVSVCPHCGVSTSSSRRVVTVFRVVGLICLAGLAMVTGSMGACFVVAGLASLSLNGDVPWTLGYIFGGAVLGWLTLQLGRWMNRILRNCRKP